MAVSAGLSMKIHAVNILSQLCLNQHNGEALCHKITDNGVSGANQEELFGLIDHLN